MRLDRVDVAEKHLLRAIAIHPNNPALVCRLGMVYERLRDRDRALAVYARASQLDPRNTLVRFKHAKALMELGQNQKALEELTVAYDLAPREANIHLLLGHVYQRLNDRTSALRHYTWALNLTTRQRHIVHDAIQRLNEQTTTNEGNVSVLTVGEGGDESVFI
jgi:anaphase-promoting complex subunit 3